ncbi:MAG: hypothetical protein Q4G24_10075 [Paracoccus sp. (in: a-proteobacteria)]|uniref:hypothetical protein n=1 Tax=Paracoccus sp. TaxID=267 RepID=UPI0026E04B7B|nr:hypothetical protein [Paracoccus sp. (in: a-proteobacteria)]MDO5621805.1 hypothetical protein [Paracoccus sp. (in: a-proteobacteria)]
MILFHGGNLRGQTQFWPLTHFGSRRAALHRIRQMYEDSLPWEQQDWMLYRCRVDCGVHVIDLPDWHAASASGVCWRCVSTGGCLWRMTNTIC